MGGVSRKTGCIGGRFPLNIEAGKIVYLKSDLALFVYNKLKVTLKGIKVFK